MVRSWLKRLRDLSKRTAPALGAGLLLLALDRSGVAESLDLLVYDLVTSQRPAAPGSSLPITVIGISESDIQRHGWPIDDSLFCRTIDQLSAGGASAIGFDLYRDRGVGQEQACLRQRFRTNPKLVAIFNVAEGIQAVPGTPAERQSYNDLSVDRDGVLRRDLVHVTGQDAATVAFPLRMYEVGTGDRQLRQRLNQGREADSWLSADAGGYNRETEAGLGMQRLLLFRQPGSFSSWSLDQLLSGQVPARHIRNQLVLIGSTAPSLKDLFEVPHSRFASGSQQLRLPGVEVHALRLAALLDRRSGRLPIGFAMPGAGDLALTLALAALGLWMGEAFATLRRSVLAVTGVAVVVAGGLVGLLVLHGWIGTTLPLAALMLMAAAGWLRRGAASHQHQQQIQKLLGQSTSPAVAQQLWEQRDELLSDGRFEGRLLPVTILFSDTANFTPVSEGFAPAELLAWLNRGMAHCVPAVTRRGGMVNKFTGDGMLAVFGAPVSNGTSADAQAAIEAALEIGRGLEQLNAELTAEGAPEMRIRIGIHSGTVLAGSMGSSERLEYAVIGDAVNCAARLESLEKHRHEKLVRVLVSSTTRELLGDAIDRELPWRDWGAIQVKGRQEPLQVSEIRMGGIQAGQRTGS
jgi:adenylate cyclase